MTHRTQEEAHNGPFASLDFVGIVAGQPPATHDSLTHHATACAGPVWPAAASEQRTLLLKSSCVLAKSLSTCTDTDKVQESHPRQPVAKGQLTPLILACLHAGMLHVSGDLVGKLRGDGAFCAAPSCFAGNIDVGRPGAHQAAVRHAALHSALHQLQAADTSHTGPRKSTACGRTGAELNAGGCRRQAGACFYTKGLALDISLVAQQTCLGYSYAPMVLARRGCMRCIILLSHVTEQATLAGRE